MKTVGWLLLVGGLAWIVFVSVWNPIVTRRVLSVEMARYNQRESYTRNEVFDAMRGVEERIRSAQKDPLWGGIAMFIGACLTILPKKRLRA
jgi:hypothetical protein